MRAVNRLTAHQRAFYHLSSAIHGNDSAPVNRNHLIRGQKDNKVQLSALMEDA